MGLLMGWPRGYGKKRQLEDEERLLGIARAKVEELEDIRNRLDEEEVQFVEVFEELDWWRGKVEEHEGNVKRLSSQIKKVEALTFTEKLKVAE